MRSDGPDAVRARGRVRPSPLGFVAARAATGDPVRSLIEMRLNRGLSVVRAAALIGVNKGTLQAAEDGNGIHPSNAKKIADFYGYKVTDLWPVEEPAA